jgi:uncharacterized alkaline shock family protein YloU
LLIVLLIVSAVVPNTVLNQFAHTIERAQSTLQIEWPRSYLIFLAVAIPLIFVLVLLLWLEIRPQSTNRVVVRGRDGTRTEVSTRSVAQTLQQHVDEVEDVFNVKASVRGTRGGVDVLLDLETTAEIDIPAKMDQVSRAARDLIESRMGLRVANIRVHVKPASYAGQKKSMVEEPSAPAAGPQETVDKAQPTLEPPYGPVAGMDGPVSETEVEEGQ